MNNKIDVSIQNEETLKIFNDALDENGLYQPTEANLRLYVDMLNQSALWFSEKVNDNNILFVMEYLSEKSKYPDKYAIKSSDNHVSNNYLNNKNISINKLINALKACSEIDALLTDKEYLRSYFFYPNWKGGLSLGKYTNGGGDDVVFLFKDETALIKGFDHESELSPHAQETYHVLPGMYDSAPDDLLIYLEEDELEKENVTFCFWHTTTENKWESGKMDISDDEDGGASWLLGSIHFNAEDFIEWAKHYYEESFNKITHDDVHEIYKRYSM